jgi:ketosteroid isomerase-like protein
MASAPSMMSEENAELVRRCYEFWARRDYSILPVLFDPDVVLDLSRNVFNPDVYRGHDGLRYVEAVDEMWEEFDACPTELIEVGDRIITGPGYRDAAGAAGSKWDEDVQRVDVPRREGAAGRGRIPRAG